MKRAEFRARVRARGHTPTWIAMSGLALLAGLVVLFRLAQVQVEPVVRGAAAAIAARAATEALTSALTKEVASSPDADQLVEIEHSQSGNLSVARFNFKAVSRLQAKATRQANDQLETMGEETFQLPVAEVMGGTLFSSAGPQLPVRFQLVGHVESSVRTRSWTVGINESVHEVDLELTAQVRVLTPVAGKPQTVHAELPVAYTVFDGAVPNTFVSPGRSAK